MDAHHVVGAVVYCIAVVALLVISFRRIGEWDRAQYELERLRNTPR